MSAQEGNILFMICDLMAALLSDVGVFPGY